MKTSEMFGSQYMKAAELEPGKSYRLTIAGLSQIKFGEDNVKFLLHFEEAQKGLVLNKTVAKQITENLGSEDSNDWVGKKITLFRTTAEYKGESVAAIRVKPEKPSAVDVDDGIPF